MADQPSASRPVLALTMQTMRARAVEHMKNAAIAPTKMQKRAFEARAVEAHLCADEIDRAIQAHDAALPTAADVCGILAGALSAETPRDYSAWAEDIASQRDTFGSDDYVALIGHALAEAFAQGVTFATSVAPAAPSQTPEREP